MTIDMAPRQPRPTLDDLMGGRPPAVQLETVSGIVTAVTPSGLFVAPEGQPEDQPVGPCRGARTSEGRPIVTGMHVLVTFAGGVPWIIAVDS